MTLNGVSLRFYGFLIFAATMLSLIFNAAPKEVPEPPSRLELEGYSMCQEVASELLLQAREGIIKESEAIQVSQRCFERFASTTPPELQ